MQPHEIASHLLEHCESAGANRFIVAIAGPPASGKSTLADQLKTLCDEAADTECTVVLPMDGFHLDNALLDIDQTRSRKGSAPTFDFDGFHHILNRVALGSNEVVIPTFDRTLDLARAGARRISSHHRIVLVEGNYLLLSQDPWLELHSIFNYRIFLEVAEEVLIKRLQQRWIDHDHTPDEAMLRAQSNDIPNARKVLGNRLSADLVLKQC